MELMETKEITNIGEYFNQSQDERTLEGQWDLIVENCQPDRSEQAPVTPV
jgi:hypothetical protein